MKMEIVLLSAVLLMSAVATAGVTNPDGFEDYALTTAWDPTEAVEGWTVSVANAANSVSIIAGSLPGNTTQVMQIDSMVDAGNVTGNWYASIPDAAGPVTRYSMEVAATSLWNGQHRLSVARKSSAGSVSSLIEVGYGVWWGGGAGLPAATFLAADYDDGGARTWHTEAIPGLAGFEPGVSGWYVIEFEDDNGAYDYDAWVADPVNNHGSSTRVRMYDKSTSPGAEDGWTGWQLHDPSYNGLDYADGGVISLFTNGLGEWDNFSITPEPATMLVLGAGSLLLLKRKRKS